MSKAEGPGLVSETVPVPKDVFAFSATNILLQKYSSMATYINFLKLWCFPAYCHFFCSTGWGKVKIITSF